MRTANKASSEQHIAVLDIMKLTSRVYYTDERFADRREAREAMSGQARAALRLELVEDPEQRAWHHTFVKDRGYVDFKEVDKQSVLSNRFE